MKAFLSFILLCTVVLESSNASPLAGEVTTEHPPLEVVIVKALELSKEMNEMYHDAYLRKEAGEDVDYEEIDGQIDAMVAPYRPHFTYYTKELELGIPVLLALKDVKLAQGNEEQLNIAYTDLGKSFWKALNSDSAVLLMMALEALLKAGLLEGNNLDEFHI